MSEPYGVTSDDRVVRAWSVRRLPFEPTGWRKDYREDLRRALRSLEPVAGTHLRAEYASPDREFADVENVLLYNVGASNYRHLTVGGLEVERTISADALHHVSYRLQTDSTQVRPAAEPRAQVALSEFPSEREKPGSWWAAMRERLVTTGTPLEGEYTIDVRLRGDVQAFMSLVKPMLDGLVSALHVHDGSHEQHVRAALARYGEPNRLWNLLADPATALLGKRTLIRPHSQGVAWNPADDVCRGFSVRPSTTGPLIEATVRAESPPP